MQTLETKDVLVIDDDKSIRNLIATALSRFGLQCDTASDGGEGIDLIGHTSYSIVVVDLMMPRVDGAAFEGNQFAVRLATGDEDLDRVGADIDDGDDRGIHGETNIGRRNF